MNIVFIEPFRDNLLPFTYTKPVSQLRCGILSFEDRWKCHLGDAEFSNLTENYLSSKYPARLTEDNYFINASVIPNKHLVTAIKDLEVNTSLVQGDIIIAKRSISIDSECRLVDYNDSVILIQNTWDIFSYNHKAIELDYALLTLGRKSQPIPHHVTCFNPDNIFLTLSLTTNIFILAPKWVQHVKIFCIIYIFSFFASEFEK